MPKLVLLVVQGRPAFQLTFRARFTRAFAHLASLSGKGSMPGNGLLISAAPEQTTTCDDAHLKKCRPARAYSLRFSRLIL